jgi:hypothetical protein
MKYLNYLQDLSSKSLGVVSVCRDKEHSTIIFEGPGDAPLLRLGWNKQDPRYIATLLADSPKVNWLATFEPGLEPGRESWTP